MLWRHYLTSKLGKENKLNEKKTNVVIIHKYFIFHRKIFIKIKLMSIILSFSWYFSVYRSTHFFLKYVQYTLYTTVKLLFTQLSFPLNKLNVYWLDMNISIILIFSKPTGCCKQINQPFNSQDLISNSPYFSHTVLVMLVWRIWYWINLWFPNWYFSLFSSHVCLILYLYYKGKFCLGNSWELKG